MCFFSKPSMPAPPPAPAPIVPPPPVVFNSERSKPGDIDFGGVKTKATSKKKKGKSSLRIDSSMGGTSQGSGGSGLAIPN
jgi:hypothetical protein